MHQPTSSPIQNIQSALFITSEIIRSAQLAIDKNLGQGYALRNPEMLAEVTKIIFEEYRMQIEGRQ